MKTPIDSVPSTTSVGQAVAVMRDRNVGALAVVDNGKLVGVITDRDIVTRYIADAISLHPLPVAQFMSCNVITCVESEKVETAAALMGDHQIRCLPVLDTNGTLAGMLTLDAIAEDYSEHLAGETLGEIVETR